MRERRIAIVVSIILCSVGLTFGQTDWVDHPDNPIIGPGDPGSWGAGGHSAGTVVFDGSIYHMWLEGYDDGASLADIGHATSPDGVNWTMDPANPVLTRGEPGEWDDQFVYGSAVTHDGEQFRMWYSGGDGSYERVGYATSPDGTVWTKHAGNPVMDVGPAGSWTDRIVRPGTVINDGDIFKMWFFGGMSTLQIGFASSSDGINWDQRSDPVLSPGAFPGAWDPLVANPWVVFDGYTYHMWYVGGIEQAPPGGGLFIGYAFSSDGITWTKHRDNPVIQTADNWAFRTTVVFDGSTWHMWYSHEDESDRSIQLISYATSDWGPGVAGLSHSQFVPAAAVASGAEGAFYQTDVDLNNAGSQPVEYQLMWLPRGEDNSEPMTSETFSLGAGMSVRYTNALSEVFDLEPDSLGALALVSSSPDLLAMSRTYNTPSGDQAGTYGQAMPAVAPDDFIRYGERRRILFASENADLRTNVGCQNGGSDNVVVRLELFDADGTSLETANMVLDAWSNDQRNRIFDAYRPVDGYVDVWTPVPNGSFYCYGSVLDNVTSDPTTILPQ